MSYSFANFICDVNKELLALVDKTTADFYDYNFQADFDTGWTGYSNLSCEENISEFVQRECTHEFFFGSDNSQFQHLLAQLQN